MTSLKILEAIIFGMCAFIAWRQGKYFGTKLFYYLKNKQERKN